MDARWWTAVCVLAVLVVCAAPARAAEITVRPAMGEYDTDVTPYLWTRIDVQAGAEADTFTVDKARGGVVIHERSATFRIRPPDPEAEESIVKPCRHRGRHAVFCPLHPASSGGDIWGPVVALSTGAGADVVHGATGKSIWLYAWLGAGPDRAQLDGSGGVTGEDGDDRLTLAGQNASGELDGGAGDDILTGNGTLTGGPGNDILTGGAGQDALDPGTGRDRVDGAGGRDTIIYSGSAAAHVDLAAAVAWTRYGTATLHSIESARTSTGDDVLIGDGRANALDGGAGRNVIRAGGGDDTLASPGPSSTCGTGRDTVSVPTSDDLAPYDWDTEESLPALAAVLRQPLASDCERAEFTDYAVVIPRPRVYADRVELVIDGRTDADAVWSLSAGWRRHGRLLGKSTPSGRHRVAITLNARGRACVRAGSCRATLAASEPDVVNLEPSIGLPLLLSNVR